MKTRGHDEKSKEKHMIADLEKSMHGYLSAIAIWQSTSHVVRATAAALEHDRKPLFGALNTRQVPFHYAFKPGWSLALPTWKSSQTQFYIGSRIVTKSYSDRFHKQTESSFPMIQKIRGYCWIRNIFFKNWSIDFYCFLIITVSEKSTVLYLQN